MKAQDVRRVLKDLANPKIAEHSQRFFKTGPGEYGEGDKFLGIRVPVLRQQVIKLRDLPLAETWRVLASPLHEERLFALLMLVRKFTKGDATVQQAIYDGYLDNTRYINNWDLVDSSAHQIVGGHLQTRSRQPLDQLARSESLWERRIAMIATYHYIKANDFDDALRLSATLRDDSEDLIHKAVGWMLREIGKRDVTVEKTFLHEHYRKMPRTMLRYAIEKFPPEERKAYLKGTV